LGRRAHFGRTRDVGARCEGGGDARRVAGRGCERLRDQAARLRGARRERIARRRRGAQRLDLPAHESPAAARTVSTAVAQDERAALGHAARRLREEVARRIVGQETVVEEILMAILAGGHVLLVGVPGLAKTLLIRSVAEAMRLDFRRIQFTPDLVPSDITGTEIMEENSATGARSFRFVRGPIFANIVLADEINRT